MNKNVINKEAAAGSESFTELLRQLANNSAIMAHNEIELAIQEIREKERAVRSGVLTVAAGTVISFAAFLCFCAALIIGLTSYMSPVNAAIVTGGSLALISAVIAFIGYRQLKKPIPEAQKTMQTEKEEMEWVKENI
ncbi:MAG: phage holin family protein [Desulfamplus sp.]|nr:phage holin family protein [Desulfamplus sp.]